MHPAIRRGARELGAFPNPPDKAVRRRHGLEHGPGATVPHPCEERRVLPLGVVCADANCHLNAAFAQPGMAAAIHQRIGILNRRDDPPNAGRRDPVNARPGASRVTARFERAIQRCSARPVPGIVERDDLCMRTTRHQVRALPNDNILGRHHHRADERIGMCATATAFGQRDRPGHPRGIGRREHWCYFVSEKSASTYAPASKGRKSSIPSPTPM